MSLAPIGRVRSPVKATRTPEYDWGEVVSEIVFGPALSAGLEGLELYSHIIVTYWAHKAASPSKMALQVRYKGDPTKPVVGVFASRSPYRPNPLGQKVAKLLEVKGNVIRVKGLDAFDGTPVLDIKPYIPGYDSVEDATTPKWD